MYKVLSLILFSFYMDEFLWSGCILVECKNMILFLLMYV